MNATSLSATGPPREAGPARRGRGTGAASARADALFRAASASCGGLIAGIATSYEADASLCGELVQDILLAVWLALPSFRGDASLKTFVASIAHKRCVSHVSRRAREPRQVALPPDLAAPAPLPDEVAFEESRRRHLLASIQFLPVPQREAILLCFEGFSYAEMAQILGVTSNAVMLRCQRAKAALNGGAAAAGRAGGRAP
ncbi:MAG: sigma-70 family RNA polymerase sigma factor [Alphaproteobacteria bacterium]|nr:sigma-70 family RNA polymerase sigma factor [Alphaproteobacteria bacterium]MBV9372800.1 sigma-70 family RNA polymerase sigma factor [Alphaproteobacteria bacterium]MBV9900505.1 sigma-70 family RNA polymerase sigma factor [Alphaproteobacteria bacterium]